MNSLQEQVLICGKCKVDELSGIVQCSPVYSFGDPLGKKVIVIAQNPSTREFKNGYLVEKGSLQTRLDNQLDYFRQPYYKPFFGKLEAFFDGPVAHRLSWVGACWEKVGFLDLVKCSTRTYNGQWNTLKPKHKKIIAGNCEGYLLSQLRLYKPSVILAYGKYVCDWFSKRYDFDYSCPDVKEIKTDYFPRVTLLLLKQRQGWQRHSRGEIELVQRELLRTL